MIIDSYSSCLARHSLHQARGAGRDQGGSSERGVDASLWLIQRGAQQNHQAEPLREAGIFQHFADVTLAWPVDHRPSLRSKQPGIPASIFGSVLLLPVVTQQVTFLFLLCKLCSKTSSAPFLTFLTICLWLQGLVWKVFFFLGKASNKE